MTKQVIVMRKDLGMNTGKMCAQAAHAAMLFLLNSRSLDRVSEEGFELYLSDTEVEWCFGETDIPQWDYGMMKKIVVAVDSGQALVDIQVAADKADITCHVVIDNALRCATCCAIGPDEDAKIDAITGHLPLLK